MKKVIIEGKVLADGMVNIYSVENIPTDEAIKKMEYGAEISRIYFNNNQNKVYTFNDSPCIYIDCPSVYERAVRIDISNNKEIMTQKEFDKFVRAITMGINSLRMIIEAVTFNAEATPHFEIEI